MTTEKVSQDFEMDLADVAFFVGKCRVEHRSVEFALEPRKEFSV